MDYCICCINNSNKGNLSIRFKRFLFHSSENLVVTNLSKWKTLIQMFSLGFLIVSDNFETILILYTGLVGLTVSSIITIHTGYYYLKKI